MNKFYIAAVKLFFCLEEICILTGIILKDVLYRSKDVTRVFKMLPRSNLFWKSVQNENFEPYSSILFVP